MPAGCTEPWGEVEGPVESKVGSFFRPFGWHLGLRAQVCKVLQSTSTHPVGHIRLAYGNWLDCLEKGYLCSYISLVAA